MAINIFKSEKKFRKGGVHFTAGFFWQVVFCSGIAVVAASFILGAVLFWQVNKEFIPPANLQDPISKERLDKALEYFAQREKNMEKVLNAQATSIDPAN